MIFGIGGSQEKSKSKTTASGKKTVDETQTQTQTSTQQTTGETQQTSQARFLDPQTEQILQGLISGLAGAGGGAGGLSQEGIAAQGESIEFARDLTDRAAGTGAFVAEQIDPILAEARRQGEDALGRQITQVGNQAGSNLNSFVQLAAAEGRADLESSLAALNADIVLQGRELESRDLSVAAQALQTAGVAAQAPEQQNISNIAQLSNILRGATSEQAVSGTQQTTSEAETVAEALRSVLEEFNTRSVTEGKTTGGGFSFSI